MSGRWEDLLCSERRDRMWEVIASLDEVEG